MAKSAQIASVKTRTPQIRVTKYDTVVAAFTTTALFASISLLALVGIWWMNRIPKPSQQHIEMLPMVMMEGDGGWEDGVENATPNVDSPEEPSLDPSLATEATSDVTELQAATEQVMEFSEGASAIVAPNDFTGVRNTGIPGSAEGTGGRPLGRGGPGRGGERRKEQRWVVEFSEKGDLKSYAAQLDFFKIELGALYQAEHRLVYMSNISQAQPTTREVQTGDSEKRLFMSWQDGSEERKAADVELFQKAGIDASTAVIMHFYPPETEQLLAQIELAYGGFKSEQIRRTSFRVRRAGPGYEFFVESQTLR